MKQINQRAWRLNRLSRKQINQRVSRLNRLSRKQINQRVSRLTLVLMFECVRIFIF
jgi:hypothetical protein